MPRVVETAAWGKQREFIDAVLAKSPTKTCVGTGGSRGGGKSTITGRAHVLAGLAYPHLKSIILRMGTESVIQNYRDQIQLFLKEIGASSAYRYLEGKHYFRGVNGSDIHLGFIAKEADYGKYLGQEYGLISLTEAQEHVRKKWDDMGGSNRAGSSSYVPRRTADFNPGGIGSEWQVELFVNPKTRPNNYQWIPSFIWDCPSTIIKNPNYIRENLMVLPPWQQKQWLWGKFNALAGQYFTIPPHLIRVSVPAMLVDNPDPGVIAIPRWAEWSAGVDYGDSKPFAVTFTAKWKDNWTNAEHVHMAAEIYEANLDPDKQAERVAEKEQELRDSGLLHGTVVYYADPSVSRKVASVGEEQSRDIASMWRRYGFVTRAARTNNRVYGWKLMKTLYRHGIFTIDPNCQAFLYESNTAVANGAPGPPIDEDIKQGTSVRDHALDAARYDMVSIFPRGYQEEKVVDPLGRSPVVTPSGWGVME